MKALVYGFYGKGNLGDDLFMNAFQTLWPEVDFKFVSRLTKSDVDAVEAVFFGGGSFLYAMPNVDDDVDLRQKKVYYVGVGTETDVHPFHALAMMTAGVVATRTPQFIDKINVMTMGRANVIGIPDIVFAVPKVSVQPKRKPKTLLVIPNSELIPRASDPHWKHVSWEHYKNEFSQVLDHFTREGYSVSFRSMCDNAHMTDEWAAAELVARMDGRRSKMSKAPAMTSMNLATLPYLLTSVVVTQRLHGAVLAEMTNTPYVIVHHHDKLKTFEPCRGVKHPYYETSKASMIEAISNAELKHLEGNAVDISSFTELVEKVRTHMTT
jgi:polysaccharide pyruvyl transferase WcaK-like protein